MPFITILDYILLPIYLLIIFIFAYRFRNKRYPINHPLRPYFIPGLAAKIGGAIFIGCIYQYYYGGGDTSTYFADAKIINSSLHESVYKWFQLILFIPKWYQSGYVEYISQMRLYDSVSNSVVNSFAAILSLLTFRTFLPTSILFAVISFTGIWALFRTFVSMYPGLIRKIALPVLFFPSVIVWGSGIFKDTLCMFALGWLTYGVFQMLIKFNFSIKNIIYTSLSVLLIGLIKVYILVAFIPSVLFWLIFSNASKIQHPVVRFSVKTFTPFLLIIGILGLQNLLEKQLGDYSLSKLIKTSETLRTNILNTSLTEGGSAYDLGTIDPTATGLLKKIPAAINVTLFRPYLWEARKGIILINALESFVLAILSIYVIFSVGPINLLNLIRKNPNIQFCLLFSLIFSFAVGISTYNFGSLSRYKIPCSPFFGLFLILAYYHKYVVKADAAVKNS